MEKKATNRKSKKEETPQVITTGIEEPALNKVSMLINIQRRGNESNFNHSFFADANYAKAEMKKDIEKFKQAYLHGTYEIVKEEDNEVIILVNSIQLQWSLLLDCTIEVEGKTTLLSPNRYNNCYKMTEEEK